MQEMVEPDRTILIVSLIGLVVIWGSVAYHKWVQDGAPVGGFEAAAARAAQGDDKAAASTEGGGKKKRKKG